MIYSHNAYNSSTSSSGREIASSTIYKASSTPAEATSSADIASSYSIRASYKRASSPGSCSAWFKVSIADSYIAIASSKTVTATSIAD